MNREVTNEIRENLPVRVEESNLECIENVINETNARVKEIVRVPVVLEAERVPTRHAVEIAKLRAMFLSEK